MYKIIPTAILGAILAASPAYTRHAEVVGSIRVDSCVDKIVGKHLYHGEHGYLIHLVANSAEDADLPLPVVFWCTVGSVCDNLVLEECGIFTGYPVQDASFFVLTEFDPDPTELIALIEVEGCVHRTIADHGVFVIDVVRTDHAEMSVKSFRCVGTGLLYRTCRGLRRGDCAVFVVTPLDDILNELYLRMILIDVEQDGVDLPGHHHSPPPCTPGHGTCP